jgi:hypothetical protein
MARMIPNHIELCDAPPPAKAKAVRVYTSLLSPVNEAIGRKSVRVMSAVTSSR